MILTCLMPSKDQVYGSIKNVKAFDLCSVVLDVSLACEVEVDKLFSVICKSI